MVKSATQSLAEGETATREQLLSLTPTRYLVEGFRDAGGHARPELSGLWSIAAAEQLRAAKVTPAQLEAAVSKLSKAAHAGAKAPKELKDSLATETGPARDFALACATAVRDAADVPVMLQHLGSVLQLLALESTQPRR